MAVPLDAREAPLARKEGFALFNPTNLKVAIDGGIPTVDSHPIMHGAVDKERMLGVNKGDFDEEDANALRLQYDAAH